MQIVVTGGGTVLGQALLRALAARGALVRGAGAPVPVQRIIAVDRHQPPSLFVHPLVEYVCGNFEQGRFLSRMMGTVIDSVFHLSALAAAAAAGPQFDDLEQMLLFSLDTTRALLDACQHQSGQPRLVFASTLEVHHGPDTAPRSADGICAALCELYLVECARRAVIDLRSVRLPCIVGNGSSAAALALDALLAQTPVGDVPAEDAFSDMALIHPDAAAAALLAAHELPRTFPASVHLLDEPGRRMTLAERRAAAHAGAPARPRTGMP